MVICHQRLCGLIATLYAHHCHKKKLGGQNWNNLTMHIECWTRVLERDFICTKKTKTSLIVCLITKRPSRDFSEIKKREHLDKPFFLLVLDIRVTTN